MRITKGKHVNYYITNNKQMLKTGVIVKNSKDRIYIKDDGSPECYDWNISIHKSNLSDYTFEEATK